MVKEKPIAVLKQSVIDKIDQIRNDLKQLAGSIKDLPPNPNVEPLGNNCFLIKSSELTKYDKWSPDFHNFEQQYKFIADLVYGILPIDEVIEKLDRISKTGKYYHKGNLILFHPEVIENLKSIIK